MPSLNRVEIIGHLGADPEMRYTANGTALTTLRVAVSNYFTSEGERKEETEWFRVVAWNKLAEVVQANLTKGRLVYVEGRLSTRSWETDGQKHYMTELVANNVQFLGKQPENGGAGDRARAEYAADDDIPFEP